VLCGVSGSRRAMAPYRVAGGWAGGWARALARWLHKL